MCIVCWCDDCHSLDGHLTQRVTDSATCLIHGMGSLHGRHPRHTKADTLHHTVTLRERERWQVSQPDSQTHSHIGRSITSKSAGSESDRTIDALTPIPTAIRAKPAIRSHSTSSWSTQPHQSQLVYCAQPRPRPATLATAHLGCEWWAPHELYQQHYHTPQQKQHQAVQPARQQVQPRTRHTVAEALDQLPHHRAPVQRRRPPTHPVAPTRRPSGWCRGGGECRGGAWCRCCFRGCWLG
mmetsp:Transcript_24792/g.71563  ORF Transcript_24792/g.71563 Transcript_24792/m.71563 type:complete len:239 (-) Transcript_24792:829-1545(-)